MNQSIRRADGTLTVITDNGDGTGIAEYFTAGGALASTENLTDLPVVAPPPDPPAPVSTALAAVAELDPEDPTRVAVEALCDAITGGAL